MAGAMPKTRLLGCSSDEKISAAISLTKLRQESSMEIYWYQFQYYLDKIGELPDTDKHVLEFFLDGLHDDIGKDVRNWRPRDLQEAFSIAKMQELYQQGYRYQEQDAAIKELRKLKQQGSVEGYQDQFEKLLSKVGKLTAEFIGSCFSNGLQGDIQEYVRVQKPYTWYDASFLAKLQEIQLFQLLVSIGRQILMTGKLHERLGINCVFPNELVV